MPRGLIRYQEWGHLHFITFSCFHRKPFLGSAAARKRFELALERTRKRYDFIVMGYVVMPEHVHLLVNEPKRSSLATAIQALKISMSRLSCERPFWQARYYDFNVITDKKRVEKLRYIHQNPVERGLISAPEDWPSSSYRYYLTGEVGRVSLETWWSPLRHAE
jgi:REP-associated tyrosine transposase